MTIATDPLPLIHSWPLSDRTRRFDLGMLDVPRALALPFDPHCFDAKALAARGIGLWECDLATEALIWTDPVCDLFGLPRDGKVVREAAVRVYAERSRVAMERLRAHAIRHRRGFTLDVELVPPGGPSRWMRLIAAPVCEGDQVVKLHGIKKPI